MLARGWLVPASQGSTAAAWPAGLAVVPRPATPLWRRGRPWWLITAIGAGGGAPLALTVAALTGIAAVRLAPDGPAGQDRRSRQDVTTGPADGSASTGSLT